MPLPPNDPLIEAIAERVRTVVRRASRESLEIVAARLALPSEAFRQLIAGEPDALIDTTFLIDAVSALVHEWAVDPCWLLTGTYSSSLHREALTLGEDRTGTGLVALRGFIAEQYRKLREKPLALIWPRWATNPLP